MCVVLLACVAGFALFVGQTADEYGKESVATDTTSSASDVAPPMYSGTVHDTPTSTPSATGTPQATPEPEVLVPSPDTTQSSPTPSLPAVAPSPVPPKNTTQQLIMHAAFPDFGPTEDVVSVDRVREFEQLVGKEIAWAYFSDNWFDGIAFPQEEVDAIRRAGSVPFIRIMPRSNFYKQSDPVYSFTALVEGEYDSDLRNWMRDAALVPGPLLVEFGTEMNGNWFPWSGYALGGRSTAEYGDPTLHDGPELFVDAYRHLVDIAREEGADNLVWFLHYNLLPAPIRPWNSYAAYYPGDEYVDWIGISVYGAQLPDSTATPASTLFLRHYDVLRAAAPQKPLAVLEFGSHGDATADDWMHDFFDTVEDSRYDVSAIALWHSNWVNRDGTKSHLRIDADSDALRVYRERVGTSRYTTTWTSE